MDVKQFLIMGASVLTLSLCGPVLADETQGPYVRIANWKSTRLSWKASRLRPKRWATLPFAKRPDVLCYMRCPKKRNPDRVRVFEIYRDADAYKAHIQTAHFKKFRATTDNMVKSRKLIDTVPISLAAKAT